MGMGMEGKYRVASPSALISAIKRCKNDIALLIGSPLSAPSEYGQKGVPGVAGILQIIKDYISEDDDLMREYTKEVLKELASDGEIYQKSFEFLSDYTDPDTINLIIRKAVLEATDVDYKDIDLTNQDALAELQSKNEHWCIPLATNAIAKSWRLFLI